MLPRDGLTSAARPAAPGDSVLIGADYPAIRAVLADFRAKSAAAGPLKIYGARQRGVLTAPGGAEAVAAMAKEGFYIDALIPTPAATGDVVDVDGRAVPVPLADARQALEQFKREQGYPCSTCLPGAPVTGVRLSRMTLETALGQVSTPAYAFEVGGPGSEVTLRCSALPESSYVDLAALPVFDAGGLSPVPASLDGRDESARTIQLSAREFPAVAPGTYEVQVDEHADAVVIRVVRAALPSPRPASPASGPHPTQGMQYAGDFSVVQLPPVTLATPLGGRPILDATTGTFVSPLPFLVSEAGSRPPMVVVPSW